MLPNCLVCTLPLDKDAIYAVTSKQGDEVYHLGCFDSEMRLPKPILKEVIEIPGTVDETGVCSTCGKYNYQKADKWRVQYMEEHPMDKAVGGIVEND